MLADMNIEIFALLMLILAVILGREALRVDNIIQQLKEEKTGIKAEKRQNMSPLLMGGMLLNCGALGVQRVLSQPLGVGMSILAIILMVMGIWDTFRNKNRTNA